MARVACEFCGERFRSQHALHGHLRTCPRYRGGTEPAEPAGSAYRSAADALRDEVAAAEVKLRLRQLESTHRELDAQEAERARRDREAAESARQAERDREFARERARLEAVERRRQEEAVTARQQRRRAIMQAAKAAVMAEMFGVPSDVKVEALKAIELELAELATLVTDQQHPATSTRLKHAAESSLKHPTSRSRVLGG